VPENSRAIEDREGRSVHHIFSRDEDESLPRSRGNMGDLPPL